MCLGNVCDVCWLAWFKIPLVQMSYSGYRCLDLMDTDIWKKTFGPVICTGKCWSCMMIKLNKPISDNELLRTLSSGSLTFLTIILKLRVILKNSWMRVVRNVLINISLSDVFHVCFSLEDFCFEHWWVNNILKTIRKVSIWTFPAVTVSKA